jgi:hypothetical protein
MFSGSVPPIAGESREVIVVYLSFCLAANFDHFTGSGKMVLRIIARLFA